MKRQLKQAQRLVSARTWLQAYNGKNIVRGYRKHYGVDLICAIRELQMLGHEISPAYIKSVQASLAGQQRNRQEKKKHREEQLALERFGDSDDTFYYIAGYTSGGAPYGVTWEEMAHLESFTVEIEGRRGGVKVKIKSIVDEMDAQMDEFRQFLHKETGEIVTVSQEELSIAEESEEDDDFSAYPDWQQSSIRDALDIVVDWEKYVGLPTRYDINEYSIMEDFCGSVEKDRISNALYAAIQGRGAFRRFKDTIAQYRVEHQWYEYREKAFRKIAIRWCEDNELEYEE